MYIHEKQKKELSNKMLTQEPDRWKDVAAAAAASYEMPEYADCIDFSQFYGGYDIKSKCKQESNRHICFASDNSKLNRGEQYAI